MNPILKFIGSTASHWSISILLLSKNHISAANSVLLCPQAAEVMTAERLAHQHEPHYRIERFQLAIELSEQAQYIEYQVQRGDSLEHYGFHVPARDSLPCCAYASCTGFSDAKYLQRVSSPNERWLDMAAQHQQQPYHLLIMGGDQVYSDAMWQTLPALCDWAQQKNRFRLPFTETMRREVDEFFFQLYCSRWSQPEIAMMLASVPTVMMWDDHDIFDGWGSYPAKQQQSPVYQGVFAIARYYFELFQQHQLKTSEIPTQPDSYHMAYSAGKLVLLVLDLRSERSSERIISEANWQRIQHWLNQAAERQFKHLFVISSIPVVHASFSLLEKLLALIPRRQSIEDDLRDHWLSPPHRWERLQLIQTLFDFANRAQHCRISLLSGDVHVAASGHIISKQHPGHTIHQLTSSAIVHPAPGPLVVFFLHRFAKIVREQQGQIISEVSRFEETGSQFIGERNWLSLEPATDLAYAANWHIENLPQPCHKPIDTI